MVKRNEKTEYIIRNMFFPAKTGAADDLKFRCRLYFCYLNFSNYYYECQLDRTILRERTGRGVK